MSRAQKSKPDRSGFCTLRWLFAQLGKKEVCGISRWTVQLRVGCLKQLSTAGGLLVARAAHVVALDCFRISGT